MAMTDLTGSLAFAAQDRAAPAASVEVAKEPLQIRIPTAVKRRFKAQAALRGLEPNQLFVEMWNYYEATPAQRPSEGSAF